MIDIYSGESEIMANNLWRGEQMNNHLGSLQAWITQRVFQALQDTPDLKDIFAKRIKSIKAERHLKDFSPFTLESIDVM